MTLFSFTSYQCGYILKSLPCFKTGLALFINSGVVTANNTPNWRIYLTLTREAETALTWNQSPELPGHWSHRYNGWKIHHRYYDWGSNYQAFWIEHGQVKYKYGSHGLFHCYKMTKLKRHDYSNDTLYITLFDLLRKIMKQIRRKTAQSRVARGTWSERLRKETLDKDVSSWHLILSNLVQGRKILKIYDLHILLLKLFC